MKTLKQFILRRRIRRGLKKYIYSMHPSVMRDILRVDDAIKYVLLAEAGIILDPRDTFRPLNPETLEPFGIKFLEDHSCNASDLE